MTPEALTALIVAITGLVGALGVVYVQVRATHTLVNSRMDELLNTTKLANQSIGELRGQNAERARTNPVPPAPGQIELPTDRA